MPLSIPEITVRIGKEEIQLQSRTAAMVQLIAIHQTAILSVPSQKIIFDCSPSVVKLYRQDKLGERKNEG